MERRKELQRSYERTTYSVDLPGRRIRFRIGVFSRELDELLEERGVTEWAFITAHNPRSEQQSPERNEISHRMLLEKVRELALEPLPGRGVDDDDSWPTEHGLFIPGMPAALAHGLGCQFEQNAVLRGELRGAPELLLCAL